MLALLLVAICLGLSNFTAVGIEVSGIDARTRLRLRVDDLDELIGFVTEVNLEPSRGRQQRLDAALDALCTALRSCTAGDRCPAKLDVVRVRWWCAARVPEHTRHPVRVECQAAVNTYIGAMPEGSAIVTMVSDVRNMRDNERPGESWAR